MAQIKYGYNLLASGGIKHWNFYISLDTDMLKEKQRQGSGIEWARGISISYLFHYCDRACVCVGACVWGGGWLACVALCARLSWSCVVVCVVVWWVGGGLSCVVFVCVCVCVPAEGEKQSVRL